MDPIERSILDKGMNASDIIDIDAEMVESAPATPKRRFNAKQRRAIVFGGMAVTVLMLVAGVATLMKPPEHSMDPETVATMMKAQQVPPAIPNTPIESLTPPSTQEASPAPSVPMPTNSTGTAPVVAALEVTQPQPSTQPVPVEKHPAEVQKAQSTATVTTPPIQGIPTQSGAEMDRLRKELADTKRELGEARIELRAAAKRELAKNLQIDRLQRGSASPPATTAAAAPKPEPNTTGTNHAIANTTTAPKPVATKSPAGPKPTVETSMAELGISALFSDGVLLNGDVEVAIGKSMKGVTGKIVSVDPVEKVLTTDAKVYRLR